MRYDKPERRVYLVLKMKQSVADRLDALREDAGHRNRSETIAKALALYEPCRRCVLAGCKVVMRDAGGNEIELKLE